MQTMRNSIIILFILVCFSTQAQKLINSTLGAGGVSKTIQGRYYAHIIGQMSVAGTSKQNGITVRQGFKQPQVQVMFKTMPASNLVVLPKEEIPISFNAFPNPFVEKLTISFSDYRSLTTDLMIYDLSGSIIYQTVVPAFTKEVELTDFKNFKSGKYIVQLLINNKPTTISIIKEGL